jgi:hypothetical protein
MAFAVNDEKQGRCTHELVCVIFGIARVNGKITLNVAVTLCHEQRK